MHTRTAQLDDTAAISRLFRAQIAVWQRINPRGQVEDVTYESLNIYGRWLHGGAWMSIETAAVYLNHLLQGAGYALVAVADDGEIIGYAEAYPGNEPTPFKKHLHLATLLTSDDDQATKDALMAHLQQQAKQAGLKQITVGFSAYDAAALAYYRRFAMRRVERVVRYTLPAQPGQTFYKATQPTEAKPAHIEGWAMPIGRTENARYHWVQLWSGLWSALDEINTRKTHRLHFDATGQKAFICCQQQLYDPRSADIYCWSPNVLTPQLLTAIRDWAHRQSYRTLSFSVPENTVKALGQEAENTPYQQDIYAADVE